MPGYVPHAWVVADKTGIEKDWWVKANGYQGLRIFSRKLSLAIFRKFGDFFGVSSGNFLFDYERLGKHDTPIPNTEYIPKPHRFQGDGTTSGIAIEMAARFGAKRIILCGMDFHGDEYWDGMKAPCSISDRQGDWSEFLPYMNSLIRWVHAQSIEIHTVSKTAITVPEWRIK